MGGHRHLGIFPKFRRFLILKAPLSHTSTRTRYTTAIFNMMSETGAVGDTWATVCCTGEGQLKELGMGWWLKHKRFSLLGLDLSRTKYKYIKTFTNSYITTNMGLFLAPEIVNMSKRIFMSKILPLFVSCFLTTSRVASILIIGARLYMRK